MKSLSHYSVLSRIAAFLLVFGLGNTVHAEDTSGLNRAELVEQHMTEMTTELDLTDEQADQIRPIVAAAVDREADLKANKGAMSDEAYRNAMLSILTDRRGAIDKVLTPGQRTAHAEMMKAKGKARQGVAEGKRDGKGKQPERAGKGTGKAEQAERGDKRGN